MDAVAKPSNLRFDGFILDQSKRAVFKLHDQIEPTQIRLGSRAFDILCLLIANSGKFVSKQTILESVWPNTAVADNNLTVQIAALRQALDEGRQDSCIQTIPGRGYRWTLTVTEDPSPDTASFVACSADGPVAQSGRSALLAKYRRRRWMAATFLLIATTATFCAWHLEMASPPLRRPRMSVAVLPFRSLNESPGQAQLADWMTDQLKDQLTDTGSIVVAYEATATQGPGNLSAIGQHLGVRYAVEGSLRSTHDAFTVSARLVATDTGVTLWANSFTSQDNPDTAAEQIVARIGDVVGANLIDLESARILREHPTRRDAFDFVLNARAVAQKPPSPQHDQEALVLYEQALRLDPMSPFALTGTAYFLLATRTSTEWDTSAYMQRAGRLLEQARMIAPNSLSVLNTYVLWLRVMHRCSEAVEVVQRILRLDPIHARTRTGLYNELAECRILQGHADEAIDLQEEVNRLNPYSPYQYIRFRKIGWAQLLLGRSQDAIASFHRALAMNPDASFPQVVYRQLAAAYALTGNMDQAREYLSKADRLWPYDTVRTHGAADSLSETFTAQLQRYRDGLRLAGERDHVDEGENLNVPPDGVLHDNSVGYTPVSVPAAETIRTDQLVRFLADRHPIILDTEVNCSGFSIADAVGLRFSGLGGSFDDTVQTRLRDKIAALTGGRFDAPIVAVGWNAEHFDSRNLALRLVKLGYRTIYWYRGGREAWEANNQPETKLDEQSW